MRRDGRTLQEVVTDIREDYRPDGTVFDPDPERVSVLKEVVAALPEADRRMLLLYAEFASYRRMGRALHLSHMTCRRAVVRIRALVLEAFEAETARRRELIENANKLK
mgnify:FL=1